MKPIVFHKIELENFRKHEHFEVTFDDNAITHIKGGNGSGKSSIVNAIPWVLFGSLPTGVKRNVLLRREGTPGDKITLARLTYSVGDEKFIATRKMNRRGSIQVSLEEVKEDGSAVLLSGNTVSSGNEAIARSLDGVPSSVFNTAIFFSQNNADIFLRERPEARRGIVEQATGITAVSCALDEIRVARLANKREIERKTVDRVGVERRAAQVQELEGAVAKAASHLRGLRIEYENLSKERHRVYEELNRLREGLRVRENATAKVAEGKRLKDVGTRNHELFSRDVEVLDRRITGGSGSALSFDVASAMLEEKREHLRVKQEEQAASAAQLKSLKGERESLLGIVEGCGFDGVDDAGLELERLSERVSSLEGARDDLSARLRGVEDEELSSARRVRQQISERGHVCPTCGQGIPDVDVKLGDLDKRISELEGVRDDLSAQLRGAEDDLGEAMGARDDLGAVLSAFQRMGVIEGLVPGLEMECKKLGKAVGAAEGDYRSAMMVFEDAKKGEELSSELELKRKALAEALGQIEMGGRLIAEGRGVLSSAEHVSARMVESKEKKHQALEKSLAEMKGVGIKARDNHTRLVGEFSGLKARLEYELGEVTAYESLLVERDKILAVEGVLQETRAKMSAETVPLLNEYASELVAGFTSGAICGVTVGDDFTITAHFSGGGSRDAALLSGGEAAAVSLALGFALSKVVGGGSNALVLDEAFTAYDANNLESTVRTIRSQMGARQIILIAHNDVVDSISDQQICL